jgi:hypothetical protein
MKTEAFVADWKRKEVSEIQEFIQSSDVVGLVDVTGIGAKQMLTMRSSLRDLGVRLRMSRNRTPRSLKDERIVNICLAPIPVTSTRPTTSED